MFKRGSRRLTRTAQLLLAAGLALVAALLWLVASGGIVLALERWMPGEAAGLTLSIVGYLIAPALLGVILVLLLVMVHQGLALRHFRSEGLIALRDDWLADAAQATYRNEIEVEAKFVGPMLAQLGYRADDLQVRVPVSIPVGRRKVRAEADWVVQPGGQPRLVIEAKRQGQPLDAAVQDQARSYAQALRVPWYLLTNGRRLMLYRRGVERDTCTIDCAVEDLPMHWAQLEREIGASAGSCTARQAR